MKRLFSHRWASAMASLVLLPALLLLAGCASDPNISSGHRVDLDKGFPPADDGRHSDTASLAPPTVFPPLQATPANETPNSSESTGTRISVGDSLTVSFSDAPQGAFPQQLIVKVASDGTFTLPYNKIVMALGKTTTELEREIHNLYVPSLFVQCTATVKPEERYFFVGGEVKVSSRQIFTSHSMTVLRAITTAGGFTDFAKKSRIEVRRANGGKTEYVDYNKALKNPKLDLSVYPNDQVIVPRGL